MAAVDDEDGDAMFLDRIGQPSHQRRPVLRHRCGGGGEALPSHPIASFRASGSSRRGRCQPRAKGEEEMGAGLGLLAPLTAGHAVEQAVPVGEADPHPSQ